LVQFCVSVVFFIEEPILIELSNTYQLEPKNLLLDNGYILCGGVTGAGCGGFREGRCANQLMIFLLVKPQKNLENPGYL
jgi:hypothetical protein